MRTVIASICIVAVARSLAFAEEERPRILRADVRVAPAAQSYVRTRLRRLKRLAPQVAVENRLEEAAVARFHGRIRKAEDAIGYGNWAKAYYAVADSWLDYFIDEVLLTEGRLSRRVLLAGPFPSSGCPRLETDILGRSIKATSYRGLEGRAAGWRHVEFGTFIRSPDEVPLSGVRPDAGTAIVYVTTFLYADFPKTRRPPWFEEGQLTLRTSGARLEQAWVWGDEVYRESPEPDANVTAPVEVAVRRPGGWWWLLLKIRVRPDSERLEMEYLDDAGKRLRPEKGQDRHGFSGIYIGERVARLALWAPLEFGDAREKLTRIRAWFERLERAIDDYAQQNNELPETNPHLDPGAAARWREFLVKRFPGEADPLTLRNPFSDTSRARTYGATYFDYHLYANGQRLRTRSLRVVATGPLPLDTWAVYDPANGLYSSGQIFLALHRLDLSGYAGTGAQNWVAWCANLLFPTRADARKRAALRKGARFSTYERLPEAR